MVWCMTLGFSYRATDCAILLMAGLGEYIASATTRMKNEQEHGRRKYGFMNAGTFRTRCAELMLLVDDEMLECK